MGRADKQLLDNLLFFLQTERKLYGDWNRQPEQPESKADNTALKNAGLQTGPAQPAASSEDGDKKNNGKMNSDNSHKNPSFDGASDGDKKMTGTVTGKTATDSNAATLESCKTLEELRIICEAAEVLKTDLPGTNLVFGVGNPEADLLLIGEAPGAREDELGEPFVGRSGQLLDKILEAIGFARDDIFIANILKHRPPDNRNPTSEERQRSLPYLLKQIDIIRPELILCLGKVSATTMLDREDSLTKMRGIFHPFRNCELMVTYHPAALLRNPNWKRPAWEDVQMLKKRYVELGCKP